MLTIRYYSSLSIKLQSHPRGNNHATLGQLGLAVHHSSRGLGRKLHRWWFELGLLRLDLTSLTYGTNQKNVQKERHKSAVTAYNAKKALQRKTTLTFERAQMENTNT